MNKLDMNDDTLTGVVTLLEDRIKRELHNVLPAKIVKVTSRQKVDVQPLIKVIDHQGNTYSRPKIIDAPVFNYGTKKGLITTPLSVGDLGWVIACDRDIKNYLKSLDESASDTFRKHSFNDSFFIPDMMHEINAPDGHSIFILTDDKNSYIQVNKDEVLIKASKSMLSVKKDKISINNLQSSIEVSGTGITVNSPTVNINGVMFGDGGTGNMTAKLIKSESVSSGGINLNSHIHTVLVDGAPVPSSKMLPSAGLDQQATLNKANVLIDGKPAIIEWV